MLVAVHQDKVGVTPQELVVGNGGRHHLRFYRVFRIAFGNNDRTGNRHDQFGKVIVTDTRTLERTPHNIACHHFFHFAVIVIFSHAGNPRKIPAIGITRHLRGELIRQHPFAAVITFTQVGFIPAHIAP